MGPFKDIGVEKSGHVALVEIRRPPHNFFDVPLIREIATAFEALDDDADCRALVLAAQGKAFCAGANFGDGGDSRPRGRRPGERRARRGAALHRGQSALSHREADRRGGPRRLRSAAVSGWRWSPISASPAPRRASAPTSPGSAFIPDSGLPSRCPRSSARPRPR